MSDSKTLLKRWIEDPVVDEDTKKELKAISGDAEEIEERFYKELEFGTGGLRGIIGAGTNRMNIYTVRKATQGLASYISEMGETAKKRGVVISYDSRLYSDIFSKEAAKVLAANGIKAYLFDSLRPTPELSFSVRHLNCIAGIMVTASHNPAKYNGYKVYWEDGAQVGLSDAEKILGYISKTDIFKDVYVMDYMQAVSKGLIEMIGEQVDKVYLENVKSISINSELVSKISDEFKIVYTPIHGTGNIPVRKILKMIGAENVYVVSQQEEPDPKFSTVKAPNPENPDVFVYAIELANEVGANLICGTDPDGDRVGIMVKDHKGEFVPLSGNQVGVLLTDYILSQKKEKGTLPENPVVVKTIVTTELAAKVCESYGVEISNVLTGFKFIGEIIKNLEKTGEENRFVFGFEESYGYLAGTYARDKDAVLATMLIVEMAAYYQTKNMTLYDAMNEIYKKHGYYKEGQKALTFEGIQGAKIIEDMVLELRNDPPCKVLDSEIVSFSDYKTGVKKNFESNTEEKLTLPQSEVLSFEYKDGSKFIVRPSGTEPKIKFYFFVKGKTDEEASKKLSDISAEVLGKFNQ